MDRDDFTNDAGWCEVRRRNTKKTSEGTAGPTRPLPRDAAAPMRASGNSKWQGGRTIRQIIKASRLPHLPAEDYKVIVRPRGGLSVSEHRQARIYCCLRNAAGVGREAAEEDSICINYKQNIVVVSTPSEERARKYGAITKIKVGEREHEASAYRAAPENTSKGLIRGISQEESSEDILHSLVTARNPSILHAKRMGNTDNVIVLFDGLNVPRYVNYGALIVRCSLYRKQIDICYGCGRLGHRADVCPNPDDKICRGCGVSKPTQEHQCEAKCQLCGKDHITGDKRCKARYKIPYLVRQRRWERRRRDTEADALDSVANHNNRTGEKGKDTSVSEGQRPEGSPLGQRGGNSQESPNFEARSRSRSRNRPRTRSRSRARSTSRSTRGETGTRAQVSWAGAVSSTAAPPTCSGSALQQEIMQIRQMLQKITRENAALREEIKTLKVENEKLRHPPKADINLDTPPATKESTPIQATPTPAPTPVPAAPKGQTPPHKRKAKENADEQSGSTLEEVKGMFQEMFISLQQQFVQMHADLQQQVMQMRIEVSQRFDTLDGRVVQLENAPKDARPAGARPVKSKPYDRPPAAENSCKENASSQNGAA